MKAKIADIAKRFREEIAKCSDFDSLQTIKVKFLGKSGELTGQLKCMKELPPEERPAFGSLVNSVKQELEQLYAQTAERLKISALEARLESEKEDITIEKKTFLPRHDSPHKQGNRRNRRYVCRFGLQNGGGA